MISFIIIYETKITTYTGESPCCTLVPCYCCIQFKALKRFSNKKIVKDIKGEYNYPAPTTFAYHIKLSILFQINFNEDIKQCIGKFKKKKRIFGLNGTRFLLIAVNELKLGLTVHKAAKEKDNPTNTTTNKETHKQRDS